jgi:acyl-CoA dehydrogenase
MEHGIAYSEEQALLAQSARELLAKRADIAAVRRWMASESGYDAALYQEMAALGWLGLAVPASYGGSEMPVATLASLAEPMGAHVFASPFLATTLAAQALMRSGNKAQKQQWLPKLVSGAAIASVALSEPNGSYELEHITATATRTASGFTLTGTKTFVLDAQNADVVIVAVRLEGALALVLVPRAALSAERVRRETLIDETRRSARIMLDGVAVPADALLDAGDAAATLAHVQHAAWLLTAADMAGGAEGVMELTVEYLNTRKQFGKLIGSYQSLKHPMVDIMCAIEEGRSLLYHAATVLEGAHSESALRMAKAQLGDTYAHAADRAIQFHGAIGFTYECHAQLYFRRAQFNQYAFGDALHHRRHLARLLLP